jgi:hypothetical protein
MNRSYDKIAFFLMGLLVIFTVGCAHVAHKVDLMYSPLATYRGGTGSLELVNSDTTQVDGSNPSIRWLLGQIKNTEGVATGEIVSPVRPQDILTDALKQELSAAGYQVSISKAINKNTGKGVVLTDISVQLDEIPSLTKLESTCTIILKMDLWKNGAVVKHSEYRSELSDIAVVDRAQLPGNLYQKAIQETTQQAVPDIIRLLN